MTADMLQQDSPSFLTPARLQCIMGRIACSFANCALTPFTGSNGSAAVICVSGWKRDLSLPKQRDSKDHPEGPHLSPLLHFRSVSEFLLSANVGASPARTTLVSLSRKRFPSPGVPCFFSSLSQGKTFTYSASDHGLSSCLAHKCLLHRVCGVCCCFFFQPAEPLNQSQVQFKA